MANLKVGDRIYSFCPCCEDAAIAMCSAVRKDTKELERQRTVWLVAWEKYKSSPFNDASPLFKAAAELEGD